jgi:hypothetical protein
MGNKVSRVLDSIVLGEETTAGTETAAYTNTVLGDIVNCTLSMEEMTSTVNGMRGGTTQGHLPSKLVDLKVVPSGSITFHPSDLQYYKYVISDYSADATDYTLDNRSTATAVSLSIKGNYDNAKGVRHLGAYLTNVRTGLVDEDISSVTADIVSLFGDTFTGVVEYVAPTDKPLTFIDSVLTVNGNEWDIQSLNIGYDPKLIQKWGMNTKVSGKKRFPSQILRGGKSVMTFDGVANVENLTDELEVIWGGTNPQDSKDNLALLLTFTDDESKVHTITISGKITKTDVLETDSEENSKTFSFTGIGSDFQVAGKI